MKVLNEHHVLVGLLTSLTCLHRQLLSSDAFTVGTSLPLSLLRSAKQQHSRLWLSDSSPSDYDPVDVLETGDEKVLLTVSALDDEHDNDIRDELKRELLLFATVTNRGECATNEERDIIVDLVTQLEALNPTVEPTSCCVGEWDLVLSSTQFFRSSPFFMALRSSSLLSQQRALADTGFDVHDRATSAGRIGRVRQRITETELVSEVDLSVGMMPGLPVVVKGTVVTKADLTTISPAVFELRVTSTKVNKSNVPLFNQWLDDFPLELPVGTIYETLAGQESVSLLKTYYVDEGLRITRDMDDNFFVYARA